jgi:pimeloyl-ACP methyl ester carboxylesterase
MSRTSDDREPVKDAAGEGWRPDSLSDIGCPTLVTVGEHDWVDHHRASELGRHLSDLGRDVTVKCFSAAETAASHAHLDNPTIANEYIFDWISSRLSSL